MMFQLVTQAYLSGVLLAEIRIRNRGGFSEHVSSLTESTNATNGSSSGLLVS